LAIMLLSTALSAHAQLTIGGTPLVYDKLTKTYLLTLPESAFGNPYSAPVVADDGVTNVKIDGHDAADQAVFPEVKADTCYSLRFIKNNTVVNSKIYFTYLPIMCIAGSFSDYYVMAPVEMVFPDGQGVQQYQARIKQAGASTNSQWVHKHSYHVKFVDENGDKKDVSFFGFRKDNHWRLDAGTRDMIRFRNYVANGLWADFGTQAYYADKQPNARSYIRGSHVEVFMNGMYHGFYNFTEYLDRKQMKLKKYDEVDIPGGGTSVQFHGMMWKGLETTLQTLFVSCGLDLVNNAIDSWGGYELEYPEIDDVCPTDYSILYNAVKFVATSSDADFSRQVGEYFDLPVLADYYLFIHVVFGLDNVASNMVWGCYDSAVDKMLTLAVWDLDATVGQHYNDNEGHYHADSIQPENDLVEVSNLKNNRLFKRLYQMPDFRRRVVNRYWQLRETILEPEALVARYEAVYRRLDLCGALDREAERWSDTGDISHLMLEFDREFDYLCDWLMRRIDYLDTQTFACLRGDVNDDGRMNVSDIITLVNYLLSGEATATFNDVNADVDANGNVNVSDAIELINLVLKS
jgi:hypothetical protein